MKAPLIGWLVAAILGAALALTGQRLLQPGRPPRRPRRRLRPIRRRPGRWR